MKIVLKIILIALLWITVVQGNFGEINGDTSTRLQMTHAWLTDTEEVQVPLDYKPLVRGDLNVGVKGVNGKRYIAYDLGQSMLMLPGDWLGSQLHQWFPVLSSEITRQLVVAFLVFVPLNVASVVFCFWLLKLFDFNERIAAIASIVWLLATTVLQYSQIHYQNNQILLFVIIGYTTSLAYVRHSRPYLALISGVAVGAALLIRLSSVIHVLTVFLFFVGCIAYQSRDKFKVLRSASLWIIGFAPMALLGRILDYTRYGSLWTTGQAISLKTLYTDPLWSGLPELASNYPFNKGAIHGIIGALFSPYKSIFIYDPLLLPCLILGVVFWKKFSPYIQWYLITAILNLSLFMVLTRNVDFWHGDWCWAARYHVTSIHLLLIPLIYPLISYLFRFRNLASWILGTVIALAITVQFASVAMPYSIELIQSQINSTKISPKFQFRLGDRFINIACLVNPSLSNKCINALSLNKLDPVTKTVIERQNRLSFLPFQISQIVSYEPKMRFATSSSQALEYKDSVQRLSLTSSFLGIKTLEADKAQIGSDQTTEISTFLCGVWGLVLTLAIVFTTKFVCQSYMLHKNSGA